MASCLQKIPSGNESPVEVENDEMGYSKLSQKIAIELIADELLIRFCDI